MEDINWDKEKAEARQRAESREREVGNLSENEIQEYLDFEFHRGPVTIGEQLRRYYLLVKRGAPERAARFLEDTEPFLTKNIGTEQEVHDLCLVLARYVGGVVIHAEPTQEMREEMARKFPRPLKTLTAMADEPYQVWRGKSERVQWKAWRQGRPTILGYGMTEEEAVSDLRYRVQPDHDGTLDGLGKPKGPTIGGNMFSQDKVVQHNKARFS